MELCAPIALSRGISRFNEQGIFLPIPKLKKPFLILFRFTSNLQIENLVQGEKDWWPGSLIYPDLMNLVRCVSKLL